MNSQPLQDAITGEDIASAAVPSSPPSSNTPERNAFTTLMSPQKPSPSKTKPPHSSTPTSDPATKTVFLGRDGLGAYITDPASFPSSRVVYHNDNFVVIRDLFPKSSLHLLLLPRDPQKMLMHPYDAFLDLEFLASVQDEVKKLRMLAAKELKRKFSKFSAVDKKREAATEADAELVPEGRDWEREIISGIHAGPSMNHLHVHVMSREMYSECVRHRKHYNSFQTPFLVPVEDFPLGKLDNRKHPGREAYLDRDLVCWRCGARFGNKFKRLKEHLEDEFEEWQKE